MQMVLGNITIKLNPKIACNRRTLKVCQDVLS
jgi:hypothetical protein